MLGIVIVSCLIVAESLAWTDAAVPFPTQNGTLPMREQERSCLMKGCVESLTCCPRACDAPSELTEGRETGGGGRGRWGRKILRRYMSLSLHSEPLETSASSAPVPRTLRTTRLSPGRGWRAGPTGAVSPQARGRESNSRHGSHGDQKLKPGERFVGRARGHGRRDKNEAATPADVSLTIAG